MLILQMLDPKNPKRKLQIVQKAVRKIDRVEVRVQVPHRSSFKQSSNPYVSRVWAFSLFADISILFLGFYTLHKDCTETARDCCFVLQL